MDLKSALELLNNQLTITVPQYGEIIGISRNVAYEGAKSGDIAVLHAGKRLMVSTAWARKQLNLD